METNTISFSDFEKLDLRVGNVVDANQLPESEKLIKLTVNLGEEETRTVFTGLLPWFKPEYFKDKLFVFVTNLEPKKMLGEESRGMLLAVDSPDGPKPLVAPEGAKEGEEVR